MRKQHIREPQGQTSRHLHKESGLIGWPFQHRFVQQSSRGREARLCPPYRNQVASRRALRRGCA
jgi:hypothetical protein